jgi:hypothetical protein
VLGEEPADLVFDVGLGVARAVRAAGAAWMRWMLLLAGMFGLPWFRIVEAGDYVVQLVQELTAHLDQMLLTAGFGGGDQPQAKCAEISPVVKPFAVDDNTMSSMPVSRNWRFVPICGSKLLLTSRGTSISTSPISVNTVLGGVPFPLTRAAAKFVE